MNPLPQHAYELWKLTDESGTEYSLFDVNNESARKLLHPDAALIWEFEAPTWEDAKRMQNEFLGW